MPELNIHLRPYQPADTASLLSLIREASIADKVDPDSTLERVPQENDLRGQDLVVAEDQMSGSVIGYGSVRSWVEDDGTFVYLLSGKVRPEARGKGVGAALLKELESRAKALASAHPGGAKRVFGTNASETDSGAVGLLEENGYKQVWSQVEMARNGLDDLAPPSVPEGFELRAVAGDRDKRLVYKANKKVYAGQFGNSAESEDDFQELAADIPDASLWTVLWQGGAVAGFVLSRLRKNGAEMMEVSVLSKYRRRGLGTFLMIANMIKLRDRGVTMIRLHTGAEGKMGGRQLYESLGFKPLKVHYRFRKEF